MNWFTPPYLLLACIILLISGSFILLEFPIGNDILFGTSGIVFFLLGVGLAFSVNKQIKRNQTEIHTFKEPKTDYGWSF